MFVWECEWERTRERENVKRTYIYLPDANAIEARKAIIPSRERPIVLVKWFLLYTVFRIRLSAVQPDELRTANGGFSTQEPRSTFVMDITPTEGPRIWGFLNRSQPPLPETAECKEQEKKIKKKIDLTMRKWDHREREEIRTDGPRLLLLGRKGDQSIIPRISTGRAAFVTAIGRRNTLGRLICLEPCQRVFRASLRGLGTPKFSS